MNRLFSFAAIIAALVAMCSCDKDEPAPAIQFSAAFQDKITYEAKGGVWDINFYATADWHIECDDEWITATPSSGSIGDHTLTLTAAPEESGEERSTVVKIMANGKVFPIQVSQLNKERFDIAEECAQEIHALEAKGGTIELSLATNLEYKVNISVGGSWVEVADTRSLMRDETLTFNIAENTTNATRIATVNIQDVRYDKPVLYSFTVVQYSESQSTNVIKYTSEIDQPIELSEAIINDSDYYFGSKLALHHHDGRYGRIIFYNEIHSVPENFLKDQSDITSVVLPDNITQIGSHAFAGCTSLSKFTLPTDIKALGGSIFEGCTFEDLICYNIPNQPKATSNGKANDEHWLYGSNIAKVTLRGKVGMNAFGDYTPLQNVEIDGTKSLGSGAFAGCTNIESVTIPSVEDWYNMNIYDRDANPIANGKAELLADGSRITRIEVPEGITEVKAYLFTNYKYIEEIIINDNVELVGTQCFADCTVENIYLGSGITTVGQKFLGGCTVDNLTINFETRDFDQDAQKTTHWLHGVNATNIIFGDAVTRISQFALSTLGMESVSMSDNVEIIGRGAFRNCTNLKNITFGNGVKEIGNDAVRNCDSLTEIAIPESVTTIGDYAFEKCDGITSIVIPANVTSIGNYAFDNCGKLGEVHCRPTTPPTLGEYVFDNQTIYVPEASLNDYQSAEGWKRISAQIVGE